MQNRTENGSLALKIQLLGTPTVLNSSGEALKLAGRKDRALLAYLGMHLGAPVNRDVLVDLIWPDAAEGAGRASLRQSLSTIRKALPADAASAFRSDRDTITLNPDVVGTDVAELELAGANPEYLASFRPVIGGSILDGLGNISAGFETWRASEVSRIVPLAVEVLSRKAELAEGEKRFSDAASFLSQALVVDPMAEEVTRRSMRLHASVGRPEVALRQFRAFAVLMETELGVQPDTQTQELARKIRASRNQKAPEAQAPMPEAEPEPGSPLDHPPVLVTQFIERADMEDYFTLSFTESIILALARFDETPVVDLKSVKAAGPLHNEDAADMARAVGAGHVLSGTVRRGTDRVRVNARLTEVESGRTVWAERFDHPLEDILDIEDELSARVATAIAGHIEDETQRRARGKAPTDLAVIDWVMRGRYHLNLYTRAGEEEAKRCFEEALKLDPECVPALAGLAVSNLHDYESASPLASEKQLRAAQELAERAIALDEKNAHARYAMASSLCYLGGHDLALQHCNRALESNPNDYHNICTLGWILTFAGNIEEAIECNSKAISLNPYAPNGCLMVSGFGLLVRGKLEDAVQKLSAIRADNMFKHGGLAACYKLLGRQRELELAVKAFSDSAEQDFPGDEKRGFKQTKDYWRRLFHFANADDADKFYGSLNDAGIPV